MVAELFVRHANHSGYDINELSVHSTVLNRLDGAAEVGKYVFRHGDRIIGSNQNDRLYGFGGHDVLEGRGGVDFLYGGNGNDRLDAGSGHSNLFGGEGEDVFIFTRSLTIGVVEDFEKGDRINLASFNTSFGEPTLNEQRGFIVIQLTDDHRIDIGGDNANLQADDFIF